MKLGILTFHCADNYGAVLQAYALQAYLADLGHDVELIDYRPSCLHSLKGFSWRVDCFISLLVQKSFQIAFERFRKGYFNRTEACYSAADLERHLPRYDCLVVGSDQVWSPNVDRREKTDPIYFFRWNLPSGTRKVAYAASFGTDEIPPEHQADVTEGLKNIDVISVRESSGVEIVRQLAQREATWVCDPVFLLSPDQWRTVAGVNQRRYQSLFTYMGPSYSALREIAHALNLSIVAPGWMPRYLLTPGLGLCFPDPQGWVRRIAQSRGVITKSFHGTAFCILMHAPFVYLRPAGAAASRATRVVSLLTRLGLEGRILDEGELTPAAFAAKLTVEIDWAAVDSAREEYVGESAAYLRTALG